MVKCFFAKDYLAAALGLFVGLSGIQPLFAQDASPTQGGPGTSGPCEGVLCALTPGSMDRPILADEATRIEAKRQQAERDTLPPPDAGDADPSPRALRRKHYVALAHPRQVRATAGRSVVARAAPITRRPPASVAAGPINAIFVLAPRPFDPYGGDYAPWLDRLAWPTQSDRAGDRTVFSADGYREADVAQMPDPSSPEANEAEALSRRLDVLSQNGFQALKADLGGW